MSSPRIPEHPLYQLLRDGRVDEFNRRIETGERVDLRDCDFRHLNLRGLAVKGLDLSGGYFRQADLRGIDFSGCQSLEGASIHAAKISGCYFPSQLDANEILLSLQHGTRMRYR